jgi:hypothetical protein
LDRISRNKEERAGSCDIVSKCHAIVFFIHGIFQEVLVVASEEEWRGIWNALVRSFFTSTLFGHVCVRFPHPHLQPTQPRQTFFAEDRKKVVDFWFPNETVEFLD